MTVVETPSFPQEIPEAAAPGPDSEAKEKRKKRRRRGKKGKKTVEESDELCAKAGLDGIIVLE